MSQASTLGTFTPVASTLGAQTGTSTNPPGPLFVSIPNYGSYQLYSTGPFNKNEPTAFSTLTAAVNPSTIAGPTPTGTNPWGA
jgi:hypothetical protein